MGSFGLAQGGGNAVAAEAEDTGELGDRRFRGAVDVGKKADLAFQRECERPVLNQRSLTSSTIL